MADPVPALRRHGRGVLLAIAAAWLFTWLGRLLPLALRWPGYVVLRTGFHPPGVLEIELRRRALSPLEHLARAVEVPWTGGTGVLAPVFAIAASALLLWQVRGEAARLRLGAIGLTAGLAGIVLAFQVDPTGSFSLARGLFPNAMLALFGATVACWLLYGATLLTRAHLEFARSLPPLLLTALLALNLDLLRADPARSLARLITGETIVFGTTLVGQTGLELQLENAAAYTTPILGGLLLLVPALVLTRGLGFTEALRALGRIAVHRPLALLLTYFGLAVLALLPIRPLVVHVAVNARLIPPFNAPLGSLFDALGAGIQTGLFVYLAAVAALRLSE